MSLINQGVGAMKKRNFLKLIVLAGLVCSHAPLVAAEEGDCQILSSTKSVDYGRFRKEEMRKGSAEHAGKTYAGYASVTRELQVSVMCPDKHKIRLFIDGPSRANRAYRFSDSGAMSVTLKNARVDGISVQLASVSRGEVQVQGGSSEISLLPNMAAAATDGQEVTGNQLTTTMAITTYLSDNAFKTSNMTDLEENYTISFDLQ
ncbi:TPA: hypothetical protein N2F43_004296 [Salmonella enterica]|nr:hypothetical protein [Salmonella enterica]